jgi:DNA-binding NtrC family response regulator
MITSHPVSAGNDFSNEREILYKLFFDMKKDVNELKKMFFEIVKNPALASNYTSDHLTGDSHLMPYTNDLQKTMNNLSQPIILSNNESQKMQEIHSVEESLNLAENEKDFIIRALKKHRSRRRDAASELGISERTLYRKIKEYDLED